MNKNNPFGFDPVRQVTTGNQGDAIGPWHRPVEIRESTAIGYSLGKWVCNLAVGCSYGCPFCCASRGSAGFLASDLREYGVATPQAEWGRYALLRDWDESIFLRCLRNAEISSCHPFAQKEEKVILFSSSTDPYQPFPHPDPEVARDLTTSASLSMRQALQCIRDESRLDARIMTRSPAAERDFDLFESMGDRLLFGMSIPTLREDLARVYEPRVPSPRERLETLQKAREQGLSVYVVVGPTFPECDRADLRATLGALKDLDPVTIFHEPVNMSPAVAARMEAHARDLDGARMNLNPFKSRRRWIQYALRQFRMVEEVAGELKLWDRLHLWPDEALGTEVAMSMVDDRRRHEEWLRHWWGRKSEWPGGK